MAFLYPLVPAGGKTGGAEAVSEWLMPYTAGFLRQRALQKILFIKACIFILPEILHCREFVNADEIAKGLSPFQPEKVAVEAGRIMLDRIDELISQGVDFAFETTLAAKSHAVRLKVAQSRGYIVTLLFFWLRDVKLAEERVALRVSEGGHFIAPAVINRRYFAGLKNLFRIYISVCDNTILLDNSNNTPTFVMQQIKGNAPLVFDEDIYRQMKLISNG